MGLQEKVKKYEKRLNTFEEIFSKKKQSKSKVGAEQSDQYKLLEEIVNSNKEHLNKILDEVKDVENGKNYERKCKFWNSGYCKFKKDCQFLHPEVICSEAICLEKSCKKRHPKPCKKFAIGSCKFNEFILK